MTDANVGRVLAQKYELIRLIGRGGMGAVYEGRNKIGKRVAIKLLVDPELIRNLDLIARFFREAQAAAAVESRHVVDVYDTGVDEETGFPFIIMAYLSGEDLEQVVRRVGALNPFAAVRIVSQAATGLARAHEAGIIHRDVKPANLFLADDEGESVVKVLDFGIAKLGIEGELIGGVRGPLTQSGALLGTPLYMSPEQAQGLKSIDARSDIWSLGMCLYQALAGRLPFGEVDTVGKLIVAIVTQEVPSLVTLAPWVPPELAAVIHQALERDVAKRMPSARELIAALSPFTNGALTVTPDLLIAAREALDKTFVSVPPFPAVTPALSPRAVTAASATTAGVSSRSPQASAASGSASRKTVPIALAGAVALAVGGFALMRYGARDGSGASPSATESVSATAPASASARRAASSPVPIATAADDAKVGLLTLKMPAGYTVTVDGKSPGGPQSDGASRMLDNGKLELHGEFQTKFVVVVFNKAGDRLMKQEVYLYDNKLDPDTLDLSLGEVKVNKPKRKSDAPPSGAASSTNQGAPASGSDLPARF